VGNPVFWLGTGTTMLWGKTVVKGSVVLRSEASPNKNLEKPSRQQFAVPVVDIDGIVDHHTLIFLFITVIVSWVAKSCIF
jgi:hypothetical protein